MHVKCVRAYCCPVYKLVHNHIVKNKTGLLNENMWNHTVRVLYWDILSLLTSVAFTSLFVLLLSYNIDFNFTCVSQKVDHQLHDADNFVKT